ncbi:MAG: hypothetical protein ACTSYI_17870 [Promethearchaeota archaeon]
MIDLIDFNEEGSKIKKSLILKVHCNFPDLLIAIQKHNTYLNMLYQTHKIPFYLESMERGFLFIVEDMAAFEQVRDEAELSRKLLEIESEDNPFSGPFQAALEDIAKRGETIIFTIEGESSDSDIVFAILKNNFEQVSKEIKVVPSNFNEIQILFKNLEVFKLYARICMSFTHELKKDLG